VVSESNTKLFSLSQGLFWG